MSWSPRHHNIRQVPVSAPPIGWTGSRRAGLAAAECRFSCYWLSEFTTKTAKPSAVFPSPIAAAFHAE